MSCCSGSSTSQGKKKKQQERELCCLSHLFFKAGTQNPQKIAVIHAAAPSSTSASASSSASSGPQIPRERITCATPICAGDQCFTFANVLNSVDSLTSRLRSILDGADDHHLIKPQSPTGKGDYPRKKQAESANACCPKILGIYMPPSVEYIISVFSILRSGEAFLPIDPSWPRDTVLSVVSSSNVELMITSRSSFGKGGNEDINEEDWLVNHSGCRVFCFSMEESECSGPLELAWPCENQKERLFCYLMYTSGSTGKPKGVCGTEQGLLNRIQWMQELYPLHGEEVLLFKTSTSFIDHLQEFLSAMLTACTLVIPPFHELKEYPFSLVNFLQAYSINRLTAVPSLMRAILPILQRQNCMRIQTSLKLLVLSGEIFSLSLWDELSTLLPRTSILNLYGSTEVAGDCTYFDCKSLPMILETEAPTSVPIGVPISNCDVALVCESDTSNQGEIYVGGLCVSNGYYYESTVTSFASAKLHMNNICICSLGNCGCQTYYRTGDFAQRLQSGDLVFVGRTDRTIKINGQRVVLEEIENILRGHPDVVDAAVISREGPGELLLLDAFLLFKEKEKSEDFFVRSSIRKWMVGKVPLAMVPNRFIFTKLLPMSSTGKVDYGLLASSKFLNMHVQDEIGNYKTTDFLQIIKKAFCDGLMVEEVSCDDDFFAMGGNSISAAHVSYNLGINMRLLYNFPTPSKLHAALLEKKESCHIELRIDASSQLKPKEDNSVLDMACSVDPTTPSVPGHKSTKRLPENPHQNNDDHTVASKRLKEDLDIYISSTCVSPIDGQPLSGSISMLCSFSRCNMVMYDRDCRLSKSSQINQLAKVPRNGKGSSMHELWKVYMESCVDASPLVVVKQQDVYLFIGSHSHKFVCVNALSGSVQWEVKLEGRIESSAAIVGDFSQVVVGCYRGKIYFLDFLHGSICWTFQACGEVKCQPVVDIHRQLIWCGSHDHNLYALDYRNHCCVFKLSCGGSIYGSPAIDKAHDKLYAASTIGRVTAISIKALPFDILWQHELKVPVFGSLSVCSSNGNVICCSVDGNIVVLDLNGSIVWRCRTGGPVFAGACISSVLPSQVLICSRNGHVYSFEMERGDLLWEYNVGDPITASAYVDEHLQLLSDPHLLSDRLVCVCTSSGSIHLLRINLDDSGKQNQPGLNIVQEFARLELPGDIFSSPVMIGGRVFVGCRDDYVHCIYVEILSSV